MKNAIALEDAAPGLAPVAENSLAAPAVAGAIRESWSRIAPFWPLKNLIAVNPLQGLEDLPFEQALAEGAAYYQRPDIPRPMLEVNRQTIKWCQAFFDDGQATIPMPHRKKGLLTAWRTLAPFDDCLFAADKAGRAWLNSLPESGEAVISECLTKLGIAPDDWRQFLTLMLTTLPGWAAHIKYRTDWTGSEPAHPHPVTGEDYLAMRLVITCLLWPDARELLAWFTADDAEAQVRAEQVQSKIRAIAEAGDSYRTELVGTLTGAATGLQKDASVPDAQLVFCIDVRSEPFRRALEQQGDYHTLGFAGFFGIPVRIEQSVSNDSYASCPVLLSPQHVVSESPCCGTREQEKDKRGYHRLNQVKKLYQSVKYTFTTPFSLVEAIGPASGLWMGLKSLAPSLAAGLRQKAVHVLRPPQPVAPSLADISPEQRTGYAEGALKMMGLTDRFAPLVILCGHGSATQNNAYATALDCGACAGRHGASNARILASILNEAAVRANLAKKGIEIPEQTLFCAAEHNTTTDEVVLFDHDVIDPVKREQISALKKDLDAARSANSAWRAAGLDVRTDARRAVHNTLERSLDWAEVRPEWGLARNAAFIVGPRTLTRAVNLEGRSFLHSYDWVQDPEGTSLTTILTAPMVVAQWINMQYLFSTLDNVAYGGGSKITKNISGKIGIMQGNASDLMHGLPLQSVYKNDREPYHTPVCLLTVVYAPKDFIAGIIDAQDVLQKLFGNGWVRLVCIDPEAGKAYGLERNLEWKEAS